MNRIEKIEVKTLLDECADTSYLGTYTEIAEPWAICRRCGQYLAVHSIDCQRKSKEYSYFLPYAGGEKKGSALYRRNGLEDYLRMEALMSGTWQHIGIVAIATVSTELANGNKQLQTLKSGGLWGIESDSSEDYLQSVMAEELDNLKDQLTAFNVNLSNWSELINNLELSH